MDEIGPGHVEAVEIEAGEQRQLLQHHRALAPGRLANGIAAVFVAQRFADARLPARHVRAGEHAAMRRAAGVHQRLRAAEAVDRFGDETLRPDFARAFDLGLSIAAGAFGFTQNAGISRGEGLVGEERSGFRDFAAGKIDFRRCRPVIAEQLFDDGNGCVGALDQGMAVLRIADGGVSTSATVMVP